MGQDAAVFAPAHIWPAPRPGARRQAPGPLFGQTKVSSFLPLDVDDRSISDLLVRLPVQRDTDRKARRAVVPNDLNTADGLAARPLSEGLQTLSSESSVVQSDSF